MKKIFTLLCVISMTMFAANAQATFGTKAGVDFSKITVSAQGLGVSASSAFHTGFYFGGTAALPLGDFSLQADLLYNYGGATISASKGFLEDLGMEEEEFDYYDLNFGRLAASLNISSINLPIALKYNITDEFAVMAGPYISYRIATKVKLNGNAEDLATMYFADRYEGMSFDEAKDAVSETLDFADDIVDDYMKDLDYGLVFGAEYQFAEGLFIEGRYSLGLSNLLDLPDGMTDVNITAKTQSFKIGLGYRF